MSEKIVAYDLLITCPDDVTDVLPELKKTIAEFNRLYGRKNKIIVRPLYWKKDVYPESGDSPQDLTNRQIVDGSDLAICLFGTRLGTPTLKYGSGTEEEISRMIKSGKQVFIYYLEFDEYKVSTPQDSIQFLQLQEFKKKLKKHSIHRTLKKKESIGKWIFNDLTLYFDRFLFQKTGENNSNNYTSELINHKRIPVNYTYRYMGRAFHLDIRHDALLLLSISSTQDTVVKIVDTPNRLLSSNEYLDICSDKDVPKDNVKRIGSKYYKYTGKSLSVKVKYIDPLNNEKIYEGVLMDGSIMRLGTDHTDGYDIYIMRTGLKNLWVNLIPLDNVKIIKESDLK